MSLVPFLAAAAIQKSKKSKAPATSTKKIEETVIEQDFLTSILHSRNEIDSKMGKLLIHYLTTAPKKVVDAFDNLQNEVNEILQKQDPMIESLKNEIYEILTEMKYVISRFKKTGLLPEIDKNQTVFSVEQNEDKSLKIVNTNLITTTFKGINLTVEDLKSNKNPYKQRYEKFCLENPSADENLTNATNLVKKLEKQKFRLKHSIVKQNELKEAKKQVELAQKIANKKNKYLYESNVFATISDVSKVYLQQYLELHKQYIKLTDILFVKNCESGFKKHYVSYLFEDKYEKYRSNVINQAMENLSREEKNIIQSFYKLMANTVLNSDINILQEIIETAPWDQSEIKKDVSLLYVIENLCQETKKSVNLIKTNEEVM